MGTDLLTGKKIAAKHILGADSQKVGEENFDKLLRLSHPNLLKIFKVYPGKDVWQMMEFCPLGNLNSFFQRTIADLAQQLDIMCGIATGLEYLHENNIIHRDIKPANILVATENPLVVKLADFDVSKFLDPEIETSVMSTNVGTLAFKAPEFFQRTRDGQLLYHRSVDVFALGLTYLAMVQYKSGCKSLIPRAEIEEEEHIDSIGRYMWEMWKYRKASVSVVNTSGPFALNTSGPFAPGSFAAEIKRLVAEMVRFDPKNRLRIGAVLGWIRLVRNELLRHNHRV